MLLSVLGKHVSLHKVSGHRHVGPCPKCGGSPVSERFSVRTDKGYFHCYGCKWNGDVIKALRELEGLTCPEAYVTAGKECDRISCPVSDKCRKGEGKKPRKNLDTPSLSRHDSPGFTPTAADNPADLWQKKAEALVSQAQEQLLANTEQLFYLSDRGLDLAAVKRYQLGWINADLYRERAAWGLPSELKEDGKPRKLWIPRGIVIPSMSRGRLIRVRIRRPNEDLDADRKRNPKKDPLRYYAIPGSGNDIAVLGAGNRAAMVVESDLDALLIDHVAGDLVSAIPLTTCSARPKETAAQVLDSAAVVLVATDFDKPGAKAFKWWMETYPGRAIRWPVRVGKDPGEAYQKGEDLRAWVLAGLPISLHPARSLAGKTAPPVKEKQEIEMSVDEFLKKLHKEGA